MSRKPKGLDRMHLDNGGVALRGAIVANRYCLSAAPRSFGSCESEIHRKLQNVLGPLPGVTFEIVRLPRIWRLHGLGNASRDPFRVGPRLRRSAGGRSVILHRETSFLAVVISMEGAGSFVMQDASMSRLIKWLGPLEGRQLRLYNLILRHQLQIRSRQVFINAQTEKVYSVAPR